MASLHLQLDVNAEVYYEKNKASVEEMISSALSLITKHCPPHRVKGAVTAGTIKNDTHSPLLLASVHNWAGKFIVPLPPIIEKCPAHFVHANELLCATDMAAVVHTTGTSAQAWLLAWSVSANGCPNKVYVEAGPLEALTNWATVKAKLEASGSQSYYADSTGKVMFAKITPSGDKARLAAVYARNIINE